MHSMPSTCSQGLALRDRTNAGGSSSDSVSKEEAPHESEGAGAGTARLRSQRLRLSRRPRSSRQSLRPCQCRPRLVRIT